MYKKIVLLLMVTTASVADRDYDNLAKELSTLRESVDSLNSQIQEKKEQIDYNSKSYARQKQDLEANIAKEELRIKQLHLEIAQKQADANKAQKGATTLLPLINTSIANLETYIKVSLPFKQEERLQALNDIKSTLAGKFISPEKTLNRVWAFYEDEIRLTKENGLYRQPINLDGQKSLVDIAKIGMMAYYFKTGDGRYGIVRKVGKEYKTIIYEDDVQKKQAMFVFDALKKQIRTGYFTLPNFLPVEAK